MAQPNHDIRGRADKSTRPETEADAGAGILAGLDAALKRSTVKTYENIVKQAAALRQYLDGILATQSDPQARPF